MSIYHEETKIKDTQLLREIQKDLPACTKEFFRGISQTTSAKTRLGYAYDLRIFFRYLYEEHSILGGKDTLHLTTEDLNQITSDDIDCFMEYLSYYIRSDHEHPEHQAE